MKGVPHGLVNQRQVGGVGIEGSVPVDGVPGEVDGIGEDEQNEEKGEHIVSYVLRSA